VKWEHIAPILLHQRGAYHALHYRRIERSTDHSLGFCIGQIAPRKDTPIQSFHRIPAPSRTYTKISNRDVATPIPACYVRARVTLITSSPCAAMSSLPKPGTSPMFIHCHPSFSTALPMKMRLTTLFVHCLRPTSHDVTFCGRKKRQAYGPSRTCWWWKVQLPTRL